MVETTLAIAGASTLAVSIVYGYVGLRLSRKTERAGRNGTAMRFFSLWWLTTAANQAMGGMLYVAAAFGSTDVTIQLTYVYLQRLLLAVSLVGLMYYLLFLQTGRSYLVPLAFVYGFYFASQLYVINIREAIGVEHFGWRTDIVWVHEEPALLRIVLLLIVVPPILGALMMLRIYRRVETPTRRFRVAMIGGGFVLWWTIAIVAGQGMTFDVGWLQALNRVVGIGVALGILLAYEPLPWMQRRFHLEPYQAQG
jgi:hypothetical protein